jgi:hypothetical protein
LTVLRQGRSAGPSIGSKKVDQAAIVENKRPGSVLAYIAERQKAFDLSRSQKAPRRRGQAERHMFKVG